MSKIFDIATHNGTITIENPATGNHRTLRVVTQPKDSNFAPGQRIIELLSGPDNTSDYKGFGFVGHDGRVNVWRKNRGIGAFSTFEVLADMAFQPDLYALRGFRYHFEGRCRVCNRALTTPESIEKGIGPVCEGRL